MNTGHVIHDQAAVHGSAKTTAMPAATPAYAPAPLVGCRPEAVVIGASAGGVGALLELLVPLPADFKPSLVVVLHMPSHHQSGLAELFTHRMHLPVHEAEDKMPVASGTLYFAPAGYHLLVEADRTFALSCEEPVLFSRPSIDVLFDSAALAYRQRVAGIVLTGASDDGAAGLAAIKAAGGYAAVQEPSEAQISTMPQAAILRAQPHYVATLAGLRHMLLDFNAQTELCRAQPAS
jgi:two-component system chemotaxis response regulator CheB